MEELKAIMVKYAVVCLNISQFRRYNIIYGWVAGQKLLETVAGILVENISSENEICARNQGDRFALLLAFTEAEKFFERLRQIETLLEDNIYQYTENRMTVQMGVYLIPADSDDLRVAVSYANQALEFMKESRLSDHFFIPP